MARPRKYGVLTGHQVGSIEPKNRPSLAIIGLMRDPGMKSLHVWCSTEKTIENFRCVAPFFELPGIFPFTLNASRTCFFLNINPHGPTSPEKLCFWWCWDPLEQGVYGGACGCYVMALT